MRPKGAVCLSPTAPLGGEGSVPKAGCCARQLLILDSPRALFWSQSPRLRARSRTHRFSVRCLKFDQAIFIQTLHTHSLSLARLDPGFLLPSARSRIINKCDLAAAANQIYNECSCVQKVCYMRLACTLTYTPGRHQFHFVTFCGVDGEWKVRIMTRRNSAWEIGSDLSLWAHLQHACHTHDLHFSSHLNDACNIFFQLNIKFRAIFGLLLCHVFDTKEQQKVTLLQFYVKVFCFCIMVCQGYN